MSRPPSRAERPYGPRPFRAWGHALIGAWLVCATCVLPLSAQQSLDVWTAVSVQALVDQVALETGSSVAVHADASSRIVYQIAAGAPADVLVTADRSWMQEAASRGLIASESAQLVGLNRLVLVTASNGDGQDDLPGGGTGDGQSGASAELTRTDLLRYLGEGSGPVLAIAGPDVPAGRYARQGLEAMGVAVELEGRLVPVGNARAVMTTVLTGELPWGIGYLSDAQTETGIQIAGRLPTTSHDPAEVWAAPLLGAPPQAAAFVELLAGDAAAASRAALGFEPPPSETPPLSRAPLPTGTDVPAASALDAPVSTVPPLGPVLARTLLVGLLAVLLATLPALLLGRWLARSRSNFKGPIGTLLLLPLVLPPVVTGFLLLSLIGSSGVFGGLLGALGVRLSFTLGAAVIAAAVVGFPLYAVVVRNAFEAVDPRYEELAWTLGSPPGSTFRRVALPLALPGVAAGAVLALARGLGEFGATVVVAGNIEGRTQTLALAVYQLLESPEGRGRIWIFAGASFLIAALGLALWEWLGARHRARLLDGGQR